MVVEGGSVKYKTVKDLLSAIKAGKIKEEDLQIVLDNDNTGFYLPDPNDPDDCLTIEVESTNGYDDIEELYNLLFPKSDVSWC